MGPSRTTRKPQARAETSMHGAERLYRRRAAYGPVPETMSVQAPALQFTQTGMQALQHWMAAGQEWQAFMSRRFAKDMTTFSELAVCRSPSAAGMVWMRAASEAVGDYADAFTRLMRLGMMGSETQTREN